MRRIFRRRAPDASHARVVCFFFTGEFLTKMMPKCGCAIEGAGAVDQMKIHAYSLVETFLSFTARSGNVSFTPDGPYGSI